MTHILCSPESHKIIYDELVRLDILNKNEITTLKVHPQLIEYRKYEVDNIGVPFEMRTGYKFPPLARSIAVSKIDEAIKIAIDHGEDISGKKYQFGEISVDNRWIICAHYQYKTEHCFYDAPDGGIFLITISNDIIYNLEVIQYPLNMSHE